MADNAAIAALKARIAELTSDLDEANAKVAMSTNKVFEACTQFSERISETRKTADDEIFTLKATIDAQNELIAEQQGLLDDSRSQLDQWIEAFGMVETDKGVWDFAPWMKECDEWADKYFALLKKWNKFVGEYNDRIAVKKQNLGRPLQASVAQQRRVLELHKSGQSLRAISETTNLGLRTVRTIIDKADGVDRASLARLERLAPDRLEEAYSRAGRKSRRVIPQRIASLLETHDLLSKAAKGQLSGA